MAPSQLPPIFNATSQDIEMLLAAQCHLGSKNMQVHMESYLWKTRPDGINVINIGKTWYVYIWRYCALKVRILISILQGENCPRCPHHRSRRQPSRYLCHLRPSLWPACCPEVCCSHRSCCHCWSFHARQLHQLYHSIIQGAPSDHRHRPPHRRPGYP